MGYNLFKDLENKYNVSFSFIYSKLFQGIKFIPDSVETTFNLNQDITTDIVRVSAKDMNDVDYEIPFTIETVRTDITGNIVHRICFAYNYRYFMVSNIHINEGGFTFDYECFGYEKYLQIVKEKNTYSPSPQDFLEKGYKPDYVNSGYISKFDKKTSAVTHILARYYEHINGGDTESTPSVRTQKK